MQRVREATADSQKVAKKDLALAAAGAVLFLGKAAPALAPVDSSSGAIGPMPRETLTVSRQA